MEVKQLFCNHKWNKKILRFDVFPVDIGGLIINDYRPIYDEHRESCHLCGENRQSASDVKLKQLTSG